MPTDEEWLPRSERLAREADRRAADLPKHSPRCVVCGGLITTRGRRATHHHSCEPQPPAAETTDSLGAG